MPGNSTELRNLSNTNFGSSLPDAASKTNGPSSGPALAVDPISAVDPRSAIDPASAIEDPLQDTQTYPDGGWKAYSVVLGSHLGLLVHFGVLNSVGAVQAYVSNHQLAGEKVSSVSWVFSIYMCIPFFLGALVGPVFDRKGSTILLACSTILLFVGFLALSFSKSIVAFIFSLSLCLGTAHALAIPPLVSSLSHWFLANRGKAIGLASLGGSVGGTIWPLVLQALYSSVGFAWAIRIVGAVAVCLSVSSVILVKSRLGAAERQNKTVTEKTTEQRASQKASQRVKARPNPHINHAKWRNALFQCLST
ncbi:hypothetical protein JCM33374_g1367 [Metschnikowia sp. JCM 33374]|nr:hypothetical protein JCM33374_g1367 [Metschnikowia sp. JCM 33374]